MDLASYVVALEEELQKITVFHRELPMSLHLITQAIESCKQQMLWGAAASSDGSPVLEEFIPLKPIPSSSSESENNNKTLVTQKSDWLRSVQLWKHEPDSLATKPKFGGAFKPFEKEKHAPAASSTSAAEISNIRDGEKEGHCRTQSQSQRKERRSWSPELHRRFEQALEQLGGSHAATPKQIRELMKVDGLTNDEVKSHLQKYRLHTRRSAQMVESSGKSNPEAPHFMVVGGMWVSSQPGYATTATTQPAVYMPVDSLQTSQHEQHNKQSNGSPHGSLQLKERSSEDGSSPTDGDVTNSASPTSSSSQTITASPTNIRKLSIDEVEEENPRVLLRPKFTEKQQSQSPTLVF